MTQDRRDLEKLGHKKQPLLRAVRAFCIECSGGERGAVSACEIPDCDLYPYRMGKNPFTNRKGNAGAFK